MNQVEKKEEVMLKNRFDLHIIVASINKFYGLRRDKDKIHKDSIQFTNSYESVLFYKNIHTGTRTHTHSNKSVDRKNKSLSTHSYIDTQAH